MTEDRDFKRTVRARSAKTGESYQAARRQLVRRPGGFSAEVRGAWGHPDGVVLGCVVIEGRVTVGQPVTVRSGGTVLHRGTVASLRVGKRDVPEVSTGECGLMLDPPFAPTAGSRAAGPWYLTPVVLRPMPDRVVG